MMLLVLLLLLLLMHQPARPVIQTLGTDPPLLMLPLVVQRRLLVQVLLQVQLQVLHL
jgi:hypothetical protein